MTNSKMQIFYTDDDADDQEFFRDAIMEISDGHTVYTQSLGDELLNLLHQPPPTPDVVFLDLNMPHKNGFQVLQEIRNKEGFNHIPVVIFSTSSNEQAIETCKKFGANMYVSKPNSYNDLKKIIASVLAIDWKNFNNTPGEFVHTAN